MRPLVQAVRAVAAPFSALFLFASILFAERLPIKIYTSADGLGSSAALSLVRDSRGFIWLCSRDGLVRFDGYRFITYRVGNNDADPAVFSLLPTTKGTYWINLNRGTDYRFIDQGNATRLEPIQQQASSNDARIPLTNLDPVKNMRFPSFEDSSGRLWTWDAKGIDWLEEIQGRTVAHPISLDLPDNPQHGFTSEVFANSREGGFWLGTNWGLVRRLSDGRIVHYSIRPENDRDLVSVFVEDQNNRLWIARPEGILVLKVDSASELAAQPALVSHKITIKPGKVDEDRHAKLPTQPNEAFTFSFRDILSRGPAESSTNAGSSVPTIWKIVAAMDGSIWMAASGGLILFDGQQFRHFTERQGLASNTLGDMVEDGEGNLWLSAYAGLMRLNPRGMVSFDQNDGLVAERVHSINESSHGDIFAVTDNWNISQLRKGMFHTARPSLPEDLSVLWRSNAAILDREGDWWVVTTSGLYRYSGLSRIEEIATRKPTAVLNSQNGLLADEVNRVFEDSRGDIWIGYDPSAKKLGLTRWERTTNRFQHFFAEDGLPESPYGSAFGEDKAGNVWIGFNESGLARYRNGRFERFEVKDGLPAGGLLNLFTDSRGRLWIASSIGGLGRIDDPTAERPVFRNYTIADGLTSNNVRSLTEDLFGNIYVGTVRGVNRLSPDTGHIKYYGTADGLAGDFVNVAHRDRDGAIWFGTFSGLSKLVPQPDSPSPPPQVLISGLRIAGVDYSVSPLGQTEITAPEQPANRNNLQVDFFSISTGSSGIRYQYKLEGADQDWNAASMQRSINFANLRPGNYRLLLRALNVDDAASEHPAMIRFRILPPIWQRWWFIALAVLMVAGAIFGFDRYRVAHARQLSAAREERLRELERVRKRIAADLHDDIGSSLTQISIMSEVARQRAGPAKSPVDEPLGMIAASSREVVDAMSDIVWAINPQRDRFGDLIYRMRRFASDTLTARNIDLRFNAPAFGDDLKVGANLRREIFLIFKESINNIAKHAESKTVMIAVSFAAGNMQILIEDDGRGFDATAVNDGHGLASMNERARALGARFLIESRPGQGTKTKLTVPINSV